MMINSCSYSTNDVGLISFRYLIKILVGVYLQQKIRSQFLKLARADSRARASRSHQVLKRSLAHGSRFEPSQDGEEDFQEKVFKTCVMFVSVKILYFRKNVKDRLVVDCSCSSTRTQN